MYGPCQAVAYQHTWPRGLLLHADLGFRAGSQVQAWVQARDLEVGWTWLQQAGCCADSAFMSGISERGQRAHCEIQHWDKLQDEGGYGRIVE